MAEIVLGIGTSHSPLLASPAEDYAKHAEIDAKGRRLLDKSGVPCTYGDLLATADPAITKQIQFEVMSARAAKCNTCIDRVSEAIAKARLDALIVIGDDQHEQFFEDNMPSILVYWGETIENRTLQLPDDAPAFWKKARSQYHEASATRTYPVASGLGLHVIETLIDRQFDVSHSRRLSKEHGEGHAFGFVHRRLMPDNIIPIVPIALNTYFPPNQPRPQRCYQLGDAIREAVSTWPKDARVGILASGGLSHFTVDEELDLSVLTACRQRDKETLTSVPAAKLNSGSSEIRNWITTAAAASALDVKWHEYVPCYRSAAGTGCGMGFIVWS
ncbi:MAG: extradiol ring-cleavage dioxygenase [Proteobacteria bacterium]|nr:extradiol ring-cleavage dioxygenase [Pseudomonadota bacterium]